jgi:hypothetical protein
VKLLLENWRALLEGDVIPFPQQPKISEEDLQFVIMVDSSLQRRLEASHGGIDEIPIEKIYKIDELMDALENLLKK